MLGKWKSSKSIAGSLTSARLFRVLRLGRRRTSLKSSLTSVSIRGILPGFLLESKNLKSEIELESNRRWGRVDDQAKRIGSGEVAIPTKADDRLNNIRRIRGNIGPLHALVLTLETLYFPTEASNINWFFLTCLFYFTLYDLIDFHSDEMFLVVLINGGTGRFQLGYLFYQSAWGGGFCNIYYIIALAFFSRKNCEAGVSGTKLPTLNSLVLRFFQVLT